MSRSDPLAYVITTARDGVVRLSKCGHWGNLPHPDVEAATAAARADAGDRPLIVERLTVKR